MAKRNILFVFVALLIAGNISFSSYLVGFVKSDLLQKAVFLYGPNPSEDEPPTVLTCLTLA